MKLPKEVITQHKIRDFRICRRFLEDEELTYKQIGEEFGLTASRVTQILSANIHLINNHKQWEKAKRKRLIKKWLKNAGETKKDPADLLEQLRKEDDGDVVKGESKTVIQIISYGNPGTGREVQQSDTQVSVRNFAEI